MRSPTQPAASRRAIPSAARESTWHAPDNHPIRRIDWAPPQDAKGSLLFLPGRGDAYEKYLEALDHWHAGGRAVTAIDWRGQAGSGRLADDQRTGHVEDFSYWIDDLAAFWKEWTAATPGPHVVVAHSMGGHLVLRALGERRIAPDAAVLIAPMLGFAGPKLPRALLHGASKVMTWIGDPQRPAWKWSERPGEMPEGRIDLLTHDPARYADEQYWRDTRSELAMGAGSWRWMERAIASNRQVTRASVLRRIETPILFVATRVDRLVSASAIRRAHRLLPDSQLLEFGPEAAHEILREVDPVRDRALDRIDAFLAEKAPA